MPDEIDKGVRHAGEGTQLKIAEEPAPYSAPEILPFETAKSIADSEPEEPDYVIEQLLIRGAITQFTAKIKAGKTTFLGHCIWAILSGEPVIHLETRPARILYCTEEGRKTYRAFLARTGLTEAEDLEVLFLGKVPRDLPWNSVVNLILQHAMRINATVVIFDTLTRWARIPADKENDPGTAATAMEPLEAMRAVGIAVMAVFHDRKSGGEIGDSQRGSSAFGGAADIILQLQRPGTNGHPNRRELQQLGRFDDPGTWVIDWVDGHYELVGADLNVESGITKKNIAQQLSKNTAAVDVATLAAQLGVSPSLGTFVRALKELSEDKSIARYGNGVKGSPYTYGGVSLSLQMLSLQ